MNDITSSFAPGLFEGRRPGVQVDDAVVVHLGMSGRWRIDPETPEAHDHLLLETAGHRFALCDPRRFGSVDLVATDALEAWPQFAALGPEPRRVLLAIGRQGVGAFRAAPAATAITAAPTYRRTARDLSSRNMCFPSQLGIPVATRGASRSGATSRTNSATRARCCSALPSSAASV